MNQLTDKKLFQNCYFYGLLLLCKPSALNSVLVIIETCSTCFHAQWLEHNYQPLHWRHEADCIICLTGSAFGMDRALHKHTELAERKPHETTLALLLEYFSNFSSCSSPAITHLAKCYSCSGSVWNKAFISACLLMLYHSCDVKSVRTIMYCLSLKFYFYLFLRCTDICEEHFPAGREVGTVGQLKTACVIAGLVIIIYRHTAPPSDFISQPGAKPPTSSSHFTRQSKASIVPDAQR